MSRLPLVLAIEPDLRQAAIVKRVVKERVQAEIVVVDSRDAAIAAIRTAIPDVVLVSALLSPRDEDDLIAHLRTLEDAAHLQTHTIPQLASALGPGEGGGRGGLLSAFRKKKPSASAPAGCDPDLFADEVRVYLQRAAEKKREAAESGRVMPFPGRAAKPAEPIAPVRQEASEASASAWASPFEWRPSSQTRTAPPSEPAPAPEPAFAPIEETVQAESLIPDPQSPILDPQSGIPDLESPILDLESAPDPGSAIPDPRLPIPASPAPVVERPVHTPAPFSVWARKESSKNDAALADGELESMFGRLGVPDGIALVTYPEGVRIRRVRVRAAHESNGSLHGAVVLGKRMLAELRRTDANV